MDSPVLGRLDVAAYLEDWYASTGPIIDLSMVRGNNGRWTAYVGFTTIQQACLAGLIVPTWVTPDTRWFTFLVNHGLLYLKI